MDPIKKIKCVAVFGNKSNAVKQKLIDSLSTPTPLSETELKAVKGESRIKFSNDVKDKFKIIGAVQDPSIAVRDGHILLNEPHFTPLVEEALKKEDGGKELDYIIESTDSYTGFSKSESIAQQTLKNVSDILERAHSRRTNSPSWVLSLLLSSFGVSKDDYSQVKKLLEKPDFIKVFAQYLEIKEKSGKSVADAFLEKQFQGSEKQKTPLNEKKFIKLCSFVKSVLEKVPSPVVNILPIVFSFQNILMPWFSDHLFKEGTFLKKIADTMVVLNPWIGDYCTEILGNFKHEIHSIKDVKNSTVQQAVGVNYEGESIQVGELNLTKLNPNEYNLQKIIKKVNEGFERLFGKQNTLSSLSLTAILWLSGKGANYKKFAAEYVDNPDFIKKFYHYLEGGGAKNLDTVFGKGTSQSLVAKIIMGAVRFSRSITENFIVKTSNVFGFFYSIQNLFMPILSLFVKEGKLGATINVLKKINPLINELFVDHIGNFRKEILDIQKAPLSNLFPRFDIDVHLGIKKGLGNALGYAKSLFLNIRNFGKTFGLGRV